MGLDVILIVTGTFKTGAWIFLLVQGIRLSLIRRYPLAYLFFAGRLAAFWLRAAFVFRLGPDDPRYYWIYYCSNVPLDLLALLILLRIYYLPHRPALNRDWPLLAAAPVFAVLSLAEPMFWGYRISYVLFSCQTIVGFLAISRCAFSKDLRIGANLDWLAYGITVPATLQTIYQTLAYLGAGWWPYDVFRVVSELTTAVSWGIIAFGMRSYDPPRFAGGVGFRDPQDAIIRLKRSTRALWKW